jgi:hypothetical protein
MSAAIGAREWTPLAPLLVTALTSKCPVLAADIMALATGWLVRSATRDMLRPIVPDAIGAVRRAGYERLPMASSSPVPFRKCRLLGTPSKTSPVQPRGHSIGTNAKEQVRTDTGQRRPPPRRRIVPQADADGGRLLQLVTENCKSGIVGSIPTGAS